MKMSNSPLVCYTRLSPNCTKPRNHAIDTITIHCMAGNCTVETCGDIFASASRKASSNYGIGTDGRIALYVDEANRSWCTSSAANDNRAVTIEVANTVAAAPWPVSDKAYAALIDLVTDICRRNGIKALLWKGDKSLVGQVSKQNMTVHRWFAAKSCPGDYLYSRHAAIAVEVNKRLGATTEQEDDFMPNQTQFNQMFQAATQEYRASLRDNDRGAWSEEARRWAVDTGLITGGGTLANGEPNFMWEDMLTREQAAQVFYRFAQLMGKADNTKGEK